MIKLNEEAKSFVGEELKKISDRHSIPLENIENLFSAFLLFDEMGNQIRNHLEKRNMDDDAIMQILAEVRNDILAIAMAAKINPKFVKVIKDIIKGDIDIEQLTDDK